MITGRLDKIDVFQTEVWKFGYLAEVEVAGSEIDRRIRGVKKCLIDYYADQSDEQENYDAD